MLITEFPISGPHIDAHKALHQAHNLAIYADDEPDLATALAKAALHKRPRVILSPGATYPISQTLTIPVEVELDGGGRGCTSLADYASRSRAQIVTDKPLDPMIQLSHFSGVRGCYINGARAAVGAIYGKDTFYNVIRDNLITRFTGYGLKFGGALFTTIKRNGFALIDGIGLDARKEYGTQGYYGINVGISERNEYKGAVGAMKIEGILTSITDDFEGGGRSEFAYVEVGGAVQSTLNLYAPYFELSRYTHPIKAIKVDNSSHLVIRDCKAYGQVVDPEAVFLELFRVGTIHISGSVIERFATVFTGSVLSNSNVAIFANRYRNFATLNGITGLDIAESVFCVWPGDRIGV